MAHRRRTFKADQGIPVENQPVNIQEDTWQIADNGAPKLWRVNSEQLSNMLSDQLDLHARDVELKLHKAGLDNNMVVAETQATMGLETPQQSKWLQAALGECIAGTNF